MSAQAVAWGFVACGWALPAVWLLTGDRAAGAGWACAAAGAWSLLVALGRWTPPTGEGE